MRAGRAGRLGSQGSGGSQVGADVVVAQGSVGVHGDLGAEEVSGVALELEHVEQVAVVSDMTAEPSGGGERQLRDPVLEAEFDQFGCTGTHLLLGGGWQVRRFG